MLKYRVQLAFPATNNEAKYNGVPTGLRVRKALGKEERMQKYLKLMKLLIQEFDQVEFTQIPRSQNMGGRRVGKTIFVRSKTNEYRPKD